MLEVQVLSLIVAFIDADENAAAVSSAVSLSQAKKLNDKAVMDNRIKYLFMFIYFYFV